MKNFQHFFNTVQHKGTSTYSLSYLVNRDVNVTADGDYVETFVNVNGLSVDRFIRESVYSYVGEHGFELSHPMNLLRADFDGIELIIKIVRLCTEH